MKNILAKSILLAIVCILSKPAVINAQLYCPMVISNTSTKVALGNFDVYSTFTSGNYYVTMIRFDASGNICFPDPPDQLMSVTKTANLSTEVPGAQPIAGIVINFPPGYCGGNPLPDNNALATGNTSISVKNNPAADPFLVVDYTDGYNDNCIYTPLPATWGSVTATVITGPKVRINWTTNSESNVTHFSIEKSSNGITYAKIGQVTAAGNTSWPTSYQFIDNYPNRQSYYRVVAVDWDCKRTVSTVMATSCQSCSIGNTVPGGVPADCPAPNTNPFIDGVSAICDNSRKAYKFRNLDGDVKVNWSLSPSNLATLTKANRIVVLTPTGFGGKGTLTATVVRGGVTTYYTKEITFGSPPLTGYCYKTAEDQNTGTYELVATVDMFPGTNWNDYHWYENGYYIGTGNQRSWMMWPNSIVSFEVRYNGICGTSYWYASSQTCGMWGKGVPVITETMPAIKSSARYRLLQNPAKKDISIQRIDAIDNLYGPDPVKPASPHKNNPKVTIKVFDAQGALRKTSVMNASTRLSVNAADLPAGFYFLHIIEDSRQTQTLKVLLEK